MKEYFVEKPMPQFGKDIYSCIPVPNEIVAEIRADAIDEFVNECIEYEDLTFENEHIERIKKIAEQLKEQK